MKKLPSLKAREVIRVLKKLGFEKDHQKGSHLALFNPISKKRTIIPIHPGKDIKKSLLRKIIEEDIGISVEDFLKLLRKKKK